MNELSATDIPGAERVSNWCWKAPVAGYLVVAWQYAGEGHGWTWWVTRGGSVQGDTVVQRDPRYPVYSLCPTAYWALACGMHALRDHLAEAAAEVERSTWGLPEWG